LSACGVYPKRSITTAVARHVGELDAFDTHSITGCVLSGLLSVRFPDLRATLGMDHVSTAASHMAKLVELGFAAPPLRLDGRQLPPGTIAQFAARFGSSPTTVPS
jgi:hypothetical protein